MWFTTCACMYIYRGFRYAGPIKVREELAWRENDCRGHQPPAARSKTRLLNLDAEIEQNGVQTAQKMHAVVSLLPLNTTKSTSTFYRASQRCTGSRPGPGKFHVGSNNLGQCLCMESTGLYDSTCMSTTPTYFPGTHCFGFQIP